MQPRQKLTLAAAFVLLLSALLVGAASAGSWTAIEQDATPAAAAPTPYIGIQVRAANDGIRIVDVQPLSPAADAGLLRGDTITAVNGQVVTVDGLLAAVAGAQVGDTLTLTIARDGVSLDVTVTIADRPTPETRAFLGVRLEDALDGVRVVRVVPGSPAETAGVQAGDLLTAVGGTPVANVVQAAAAVQTYAPGDTVTLTLTRGGTAVTADAVLISAADARVARGMGGALTYDAAQQALIVGDLPANSPLVALGLQSGDVITAINGQPITTDTLRFGQLADGDTFTLTVTRDGATVELTVAVSDLLPFFGNRDGGRRGNGNMPGGNQPGGMGNCQPGTGSCVPQGGQNGQPGGNQPGGNGQPGGMGDPNGRGNGNGQPGGSVGTGAPGQPDPNGAANGQPNAGDL